MNTAQVNQPPSPTSTYSDETLAERSPAASWSPSYSVASTLVDSTDGTAVGSFEGQELRTSEDPRPASAPLAADSTLRTEQRLSDENVRSLLSARSFGSDETAVDSLAGSTATIASTAQDDLEDAIMSGNVDQVEALCLMGVALSEDRLFLLYEACLRGPHMVNALALHPAHDFAGYIDGPTSDNVFHMVLRTPAIDFVNLWADGAGTALSIKEAVIRLLLQKNVDFTLRDRLGDTILHTVCGDIGVLNLQKETEGFIFLERFLGKSDDGYSETVVQTCRSMINLQNAGRINQDGTHQKFWHTPLSVAILYNNLKCARLLLEHGADPRITGEWGEPPMYFAVRNNSIDAVRLLLAYGARPTTSAYSLPCSAALFEVLEDGRRGHYTRRG